jgi:hypothetical protein
MIVRLIVLVLFLVSGRAPTYPRSCAWPRCKRPVPKSHLMCRGHWSALPKTLRDRIWEHFQPGQTAATCSQTYREVLCEVLAWARERQLEQDRAAERLADMQSRQGSLW